MTTVPFHSKKSAAALLRRLHERTDAPLSAMIEIADRCNEVCVHCYQVQGRKGEISTSDWKRILDELASMGVLFLTISGGEATLRKDFLDIVAYARELKFAVKIYTNGITMTAELARALADLAVQEVQISLYSTRAEAHDWVTGVPGSWERTVAGVRHLVGAGVPVVLKSPLMSFNVDEVHAYAAFATELGADYSVDPTLDPREDGDRTPESLAIGAAEYVRVMRDPTLTRVRETVPEVPLTNSVCGACSGNVHIEANGEIRPCTLLGVPVGNALREGVKAAYEGNPEARMIRHLTWGDLHGCRDCDLRPYCGRCFATAKTQGGDALGPYEGACRRARLSYEVVHRVAPVIAPAPEIGRDGRLGPYRRERDGVFRCIEDRITAEDEERAARHSWIRDRPREAPTAARAGELVQLRRPGRKKAIATRVPAPFTVGRGD
ncbi:MAG TPA: radical SAM protein [Sandaracinaceae bacterium]